jgi:hypothetical protein
MAIKIVVSLQAEFVGYPPFMTTIFLQLKTVQKDCAIYMPLYYPPGSATRGCMIASCILGRNVFIFSFARVG